jgi:hypothetical protein
MAKYRTKPVEVEAVQVLAADYNGVDFDDMPFTDIPGWLQTAILNEVVEISTANHTDYAEWKIHFYGEEVIVTPGDWLVLGPSGELIPMLCDVFKTIYEKVEEDD